MLGFTDGGTGPTGELSIGDTFVNYVAVRITGITDFNDSSLLTGTNYAQTHELTVLMELSGTQTELKSYTIDSLDAFEIYFDAGD